MKILQKQQKQVKPDATQSKYEVPNKEFKNNPRFVAACEKAGIEPTARQASKYRRGKGKAKNNS